MKYALAFLAGWTMAWVSSGLLDTAAAETVHAAGKTWRCFVVGGADR